MSAVRDVDELLVEHATDNSLAALALALDPADGAGPVAGPMNLTAQGAGRTAGAPRVARTAGRAGRHAFLRFLRLVGPFATGLVGLLLIGLGIHISLSTPLLSGGQLLAGPWLITAGGALTIRVTYVQLRRHP